MTKLWTPSYRLFKETLERMCRWTTPHGHEAMMYPMLPVPPYGEAPGAGPGYAKAEYIICPKTGNYWVHIPGRGDEIMWTSHLDTVGDFPEPVNLKWTGDVLHTDGKTILGADDKVGVAIMSMMIRAGVPGTYVFFAGEEVGCIGSKAAANAHEWGDHPYKACISLDRKGESSFITHQLGTRCCGQDWAQAMCDLIKKHSRGKITLKPDSTGVYTDSRSFVDVIDQCTNISVGYLDQHNTTERVNVRFAYDLCLALISLVRGDGVPDIKRDYYAEQDESDDYQWWTKPFKYATHKARRLSKPQRKAQESSKILEMEYDLIDLEDEYEQDPSPELKYEIQQLKDKIAKATAEYHADEPIDNDDDLRYDSSKYSWGI